MDEHGFSDAVQRLDRVNEVIAKLDPAIRAAAFGVLARYVSESAPVVSAADGTTPGGDDTAAVAFTVMTEAAVDAESDLKMILNQIRSATAAKRRLRELICRVAADIAANTGKPEDGLTFASGGLGSEAAYHRAPLPAPDPSCAGGVLTVATDLHPGQLMDVEQLLVIRESLQSKLDSMSEMSEMESLRLQLAMDRRSKMFTTLSNIMKKISDTDSTLIGNLK